MAGTRTNTTVTASPEDCDCDCSSDVPCEGICYYVLGEQSYLAIDLPEYGPLRTIPLELSAVSDSGNLALCTRGLTRFARRWICIGGGALDPRRDGFYYVDTVTYPTDPADWTEAVPGARGYFAPQTWAGIQLYADGEIRVEVLSIQIDRFDGHASSGACGDFLNADLTRVIRLASSLPSGDRAGWPQDCPDVAMGPGTPLVELLPSSGGGESRGTEIVGSAWITTDPNATPMPVTYSDPTWTNACNSITFCITITGGSLGQRHVLTVGHGGSTREATRFGPGQICACIPITVPVLPGEPPPVIDVIDIEGSIDTFRAGVVTASGDWSQPDIIGLTYCPPERYSGPGWYCVGLGPDGELTAVDPAAIGCVFLDFGAYEIGCDDVPADDAAIVNGPHEAPVSDECRSEYLITYPDGSVELVQEFCFVPEGV